ncbi:MAG TPA: hypothetical protein VJA21_14725 [Verrucomicrobiae bacterium]
MFGTKALDELHHQKEVLLLESTLNRLKLQAELQNLRSFANPLGGLTGKTQGVFPLLLLLAPIAGFLAFRRFRRPDSFPGRIVSLAKLILPLYQLWRRFSSTVPSGK